MALDWQPTLNGELLTLRPLRLDDFEALYAAASDPLIWALHPEPTRHTRPVFQQYFDGALASGGAFAIIERSSGKIIGSTRYNEYRPGPPSEIEIGYTFLRRAFWGGRYNGEMKRLMVDYALGLVDRVVFRAGENNLRSRRALEKIGARLLGPSDQPAQDGGVNLLYAITR